MDHFPMLTPHEQLGETVSPQPTVRLVMRARTTEQNFVDSF